MDRSKIIDTLKQRGGFITTGEVKSRGEYEQLRRAIEDGTLMRIRNGVYVEMSALANNMIDVERIVPWRKRSIPTHSEWLYPLTFDAGKGLKEA
uniref:type IV toxin-antitoxin system AbiEi family antitoxin domain-containing protein n=1 Tax=Segatella hominis TaxID=2518605 RepID=UPI00402A14DC